MSYSQFFAVCVVSTCSHQQICLFHLECFPCFTICACVGFTDWKEHGVVGVRPIMMNFFLTVQVNCVFFASCRHTFEYMWTLIATRTRINLRCITFCFTC